MRFLTKYQTNNRCYKTAKKANHIGILIHSTGAVNKNCKRYVDYPEELGKNQYNNTWNNSETDKMVHGFIGLDKDGKICFVQTLPYEYACWGSGKGSKGSRNYNPNAHLQFEICQGSNTDSDYYWKAISAAEDVCVMWCKKFGFDSSAICSHKEAAEAGYASNHADPDVWMKNFGDTMNKFRSRVQTKLNGGAVPPEEVEEPKLEELKYATYTVGKGDNLWKIARKYLGKGNRYKEIMKLNELDSEDINVGDILKLPEK